MIVASTIRDKVKADVDAEGSDYYTDALDYIPAINKSIDWCVAVINMAYAQKKISEEAFVDLTRVRIYQTSTFSRILLPGATQTDTIWTILSVLPLPVCYPNNNITVTASDVASFFRGDLSFRSCANTCERLTVEEWEQNVNNPFEAGHNIETGETASVYGYLAPQDYTSSAYVVPGSEIEIRPALSKRLCAIRYAKVPTQITAIGNNIEFPQSMADIIYLKTLANIGIKQGDQSTIIGNADRDLKVLLAAFA